MHSGMLVMLSLEVEHHYSLVSGKISSYFGLFFGKEMLWVNSDLKDHMDEYIDPVIVVMDISCTFFEEQLE
jgi:hypothetical protein